MLTREQALAAMDAHIIRVEAERRRRLERRTWHLKVMFPALRQVPIESINDLMDQARRHALRQWTLYLVAACLLAVACWFLLMEPWLGLGPSLKENVFPWYFSLMAVMALTINLHIRAYLRREVPLLYGTQPRKPS